MKHVEKIRAYVLNRMVPGLKYTLSVLGDNNEALERLKGPEGQDRIARITDKILEELGHEVVVPPDDAHGRGRSQSRKAIRS